MKKVLITGIAGFIGSSLAATLEQDGVEVVGIDRLTDYYSTKLKAHNLRNLEKTRVVTDDVRSADLASLLDGVDTIFHQAGQPGVRPSWGTKFANYVFDNILSTQALLEAALNSATLTRFVYASSSSIYGDAESYPTTENSVPRPRSPYGVTKLSAEHLTTLYAKSFGLPTVSLRYFTVFGPGQRPDMAFTRFIVNALRDRPVQVFGDGRQIRDFTYIADIVRANIAVATGDLPNFGRVYNVCGGSAVDVNSVIEELGGQIGSKIAVARGEPVPGDVRQTGGSSAQLQHDVGWCPLTKLENGLAKQIGWARENVELLSEAVDGVR